MKCIRCQQDIPEGSLFCNRCGKKQSSPVQQKQRRRRAKGTGSVYKLSGKRARPWAISLGGKVLGTYATSSEAVTALDEIVATQTPSEHLAYTFADVYRAWSDIHFQKVGKSAVTNYRNAYKAAKSLHNKRFRSLRVDDYQDIINQIKANGAGHATCSEQKKLFSQMCQYGMQLDIINKNYAQFLHLPPVPPPKNRTLSAEEIAAIHALVDDAYLGNIARFTICLIETGCRINELLTMRQADVHLSERYMVGGSKTEAGKNRVIPISKTIVPFVTDWMQTPGEYLFQYKGTNMVPRTARYQFDLLMEKCGINGVSPHTCRHTAATRMVLAGVDPAKTKQILGHAKINTTIDKYTHIDISALVDAVDNLTTN